MITQCSELRKRELSLSLCLSFLFPLVPSLSLSLSHFLTSPLPHSVTENCLTDSKGSLGLFDSVRIFSIPLAKTLLLMSALVYERKDSYVYTATQLTQQAQRVKNDTAKRNRLLNEAEMELNKSEEVIREQVSLTPRLFYSIRW